MTNLREKLARALAPVSWSVFDRQDPPQIERVRDHHEVYRSHSFVLADSVLATIEESGMVIVPREATEEMVIAGRTLCADTDPEALGEVARFSWEKMIDAAKEER